MVKLEGEARAGIEPLSLLST